MTCCVEPGDDGGCEIHHGVVTAVDHVPRSHAAATVLRDWDGRARIDLQVSQGSDRDLWIAFPGRPDRRFVVGEWFGALPGHEVTLTCATGSAQPFRLHNLSTGQLEDLFRPRPFNPAMFAVVCMLAAAVLALPVWGAAWMAWHDLRPMGEAPPPLRPFAIAIYGAVLVLVLLIAVPHAGTKARRRRWARRVVDARLAAFEAARRCPPPGRVAARRPAAGERRLGR